MSLASDIGKGVGGAALEALAPAVKKGLESLIHTIVTSKDPGIVQRAALAEATKAASRVAVAASFAAKREAKAAVKNRLVK